MANLALDESTRNPGSLKKLDGESYQLLNSSSLTSSSYVLTDAGDRTSMPSLSHAAPVEVTIKILRQELLGNKPTKSVSSDCPTKSSDHPMIWDLSQSLVKPQSCGGSRRGMTPGVGKTEAGKRRSRWVDGSGSDFAYLFLQ
jgi:hypothetical protein